MGVTDDRFKSAVMAGNWRNWFRARRSATGTVTTEKPAPTFADTLATARTTIGIAPVPATVALYKGRDPQQDSWPHFSRAELQCRCGCGRMEMQHEFMRRLEKLRKKFDRPMRVTSAYRCPEHNSRVSKTGRDGPHTTGMAVDIQIAGEDALDLLFLAIGHGFSGVGVSQSGPHKKRFIHLDRLKKIPGRSRPWLWSYRT